MQLVYSNPEEITITVTLDEGESLGDLVGPTVAHVPVDPDNRHYADILEQELEIGPYVPPAPPLPPISRRQFFQVLALNELITTDEALAAVQTGAIPAAMEAAIDAIESPDEQFNMRMLVSGASEFHRDNPLVEAVGEANGMTPDQIDDLWRQGATL